jgi:hypothetical protein
MQLSIRFNDTNRLLFLQLADVSKFKEYSNQFPISVFNNLKETSSNIFNDEKKMKVEFEV